MDCVLFVMLLYSARKKNCSQKFPENGDIVGCVSKLVSILILVAAYRNLGYPYPAPWVITTSVAPVH